MSLHVLAPVRVVAHPVDRRLPALPAPEQESGAVWGSPAAFEHMGGAPEKQLRYFAGSVPRPVLIRGIETFREASVHAVPLADKSAEVEGIASVTFDCGVREIRHEERVSRGASTVVRPTIEHRRQYLRFVFPFSAARSRGEQAPPDTPPLPVRGAL